MLKQSNFAPISRKIELILRYNFAIMGVKFDNSLFKFYWLLVARELFFSTQGLFDQDLYLIRSFFRSITSI